MAKKVALGNGKFIQQTNKKRPGRHSKRPNKRNSRKPYVGQGRKQEWTSVNIQDNISY